MIDQFLVSSDLINMIQEVFSMTDLDNESDYNVVKAIIAGRNEIVKPLREQALLAHSRKAVAIPSVGL